MSTPTEWSHLPNAVHIDRILASFKSHSDQWKLAWEVTDNVADEDMSWDNAWDTARKVESDAVRDAIWLSAAAVIWDEERTEVWHAVSSALLCLIAYDDCGHMLDSEVGELKMLAALGDQKAILMLPACIVFNTIKEIA